MGVFDRLSDLSNRLFNRNKEESTQNQQQAENPYEKHSLAVTVYNLVDKINRTNSLDPSIRNLRNKSVSDFERQSSAELQQLQTNLSKALNRILETRAMVNAKHEELQKAMQTGEKLEGQTDHDLDFSQRGD